MWEDEDNQRPLQLPLIQIKRWHLSNIFVPLFILL